jgi:hypothetical protein
MMPSKKTTDAKYVCGDDVAESLTYGQVPLKGYTLSLCVLGEVQELAVQVVLQVVSELEGRVPLTPRIREAVKDGRGWLAERAPVPVFCGLEEVSKEAEDCEWAKPVPVAQAELVEGLALQQRGWRATGCGFAFRCPSKLASRRKHPLNHL